MTYQKEASNWAPSGNKQQKRRRRQKHRVLKAQDKLMGMNPYDFAALLTALDDLDVLPDFKLASWGDEPPRGPTRWERLKQFLFGSKDA